MAYKKAIFLDFDGVLNNTGSFILGRQKAANDPNWDVFANPDEISVHLIDRLLDGQEDVGIVVSSSWRKHPEYGQTVEKLQRTLREQFGLRNWRRVFSFTPSAKDGMSSGLRGLEVNSWLDEHGSGLERYVIIDDDADFLPDQNRNLVRTTTDRGFGFPDYLEVKRILRINKKDPVL